MKEPEGAPGKPGSRATTVHAERIWDEAWSAMLKCRSRLSMIWNSIRGKTAQERALKGGVAIAPTFPRSSCPASQPEASGLPSEAGGKLFGAGAQQSHEPSKALCSGDALSGHPFEQRAMGCSEGLSGACGCLEFYPSCHFGRYGKSSF